MLSKPCYRVSTRHRFVEMQSLQERFLLIHTTHLCQIRTLNLPPNSSKKRTQLKAQQTSLGPWRTPKPRSLATCSHIRCRERSPLLKTKGAADTPEGILPPKSSICLKLCQPQKFLRRACTRDRQVEVMSTIRIGAAAQIECLGGRGADREAAAVDTRDEIAAAWRNESLTVLRSTLPRRFPSS